MPNYESGISGVIPIKDNFALDYCAHLGVKSLLPVCDEVIIVDAGSTDNTVQFFNDWSLTEPKIRVIHYDLPRLPTPEEVERDDPNRPPGNPVMLIPWINAGRLAAKYDWQLHLDGDEVLDPCSYSWMNYYKMEGSPVYIRRLNLWGSPQWEAPHGTVCGENVVRFGPTRMEMHSDEPCPEGEPEIRRNASQADGPLIVHLGFLRKQENFLHKSRIMQAWLMNTYDPRLREAEQTGKSWVELSPFPESRPLISCNRKFAPYVNEWLVSHGYTLNT
jgi:glycosyltransferase involved in cell wall biosynthesis